MFNLDSDHPRSRSFPCRILELIALHLEQSFSLTVESLGLKVFSAVTDPAIYIYIKDSAQVDSQWRTIFV